MRKVIFLTGATGFLGSNLIPRILKGDTECRLVTLVRGSSDEEAKHRLVDILRFVSPKMLVPEVERRIHVLCGDITLESMGLAESVINRFAPEVTHIIHSAANVQFHLSLEQVRPINVQGTKNLIRFAQRIKEHGNLQRVAYISTAYVSGDRHGMVYERDLDGGQQFGNSYEQSKFEAEGYVRGLIPQLPITIFRPSIIVGDSQTGKTTTFNVLYAPLRMIYQGLLRILPGCRSTPLDVVPVDYVSNAIYHIFMNTNHGIGETFHLTAGKHFESTTGEVVDTAVEYFNEANPGSRIRNVTFLPLSLYRSSIQFVQERMKRILQAMEQYIPYLCVSRTFDNSSTRSALRGTNISMLHFNNYSRTLLQYCLEADWGNRLNLAVEVS